MVLGKLFIILVILFVAFREYFVAPGVNFEFWRQANRPSPKTLFRTFNFIEPEVVFLKIKYIFLHNHRIKKSFLESKLLNFKYP